MAKMKNIIKSTAEYTECFYDFLGIARDGDRSNKRRLAYCENVYRDYDGDNPAAIESIPGYRAISTSIGRVHGIYSLNGTSILHAGGGIYLISFGTHPSDSSISRLADISNLQSTSFCFGSYLYIFAGEDIVRIKDDPIEGLLVENVSEFYIPTLYLNGTAYEARNLLTDRAYECFDIIDARETAFETLGLRYSIIDPNLLLCAVSGADEDVSGEVGIPGYKLIGGVRYQVQEISDTAFINNSKITSLRISEGVKRIGRMAFYNCSSLKTVYTPYSLVSIDNGAFNHCVSLKKVYLRENLSYFGFSAFTASLSIEEVHYSGSEEEFKRIEGYSSLDALTKVYNSTDFSHTAEFKLSATFESIGSVTIDGETVDYQLIEENGLLRAVRITLEKHWQHNGKRLTVDGILPDLVSSFNGTDEGGRISGRGVIQNCTIAELFDGRVFLSGNPDVPAAVFYCSRTKDGVMSPLYFGEFNYFCDGTPASKVVSLRSVKNSLAVFKDRDDGMGGIFYHTGLDTSDNVLPRIYPVTDVHSGTRCYGATISFLDEIMFLSDAGLCAIEKQTVSMERGIAQRSSNVNAYLLQEDLSEASLHLWMGYIAVCCKSSIYLADTRATFIGERGNVEYEWFIIKEIADSDGKAIYRYSDTASSEEFSVKEGSEHEICVDNTYSSYHKGRYVYYSKENGKSYEVYRTGNTVFSSPQPPIKYFTVGKRLFFATESGRLCVFNNDTRGKLPKGFSYTEEDFPNNEKRIHPYYYSFDGAIPRYVIRTVKTDCGIPHLTKSSVKGSLVLKLGRGGSSKLICEVGTDNGGYTECARLFDTPISFAELSFFNMSFAPEGERSLVVRESEKGWIDKDVTLYTKDYSRPIILYGAAFRYKIKGRIKQN